MQLVEQKAFVLHSRSYKETSALVTFFSAEQGKFNAIVRGVRGSKKAHLKAALLQPFQQVSLTWRPRENQDLVSLQSLESGGMSVPLHGEIAVCGLYLNELLYRLLYAHVVHENLYHDYCDLLLYLAQLQLLDENERKLQQAKALRWFELRLLIELGHGFHLEEDADRQPVITQNDYLFYPDFGFEVWQPEVHKGKPWLISGHCIQQLEALSLKELEDMEFDSHCLKSARQLLQMALAPYLGNRPIQARQLLLRK